MSNIDDKVKVTPRKYNFLYRTTRIHDGSYYIGIHSTDVLDDGYLGSGRKMVNSKKFHGAAAHVREILEFTENREQLIELERLHVTKEVLADPLCMNLILGGGDAPKRSKSAKENLIAAIREFFADPVRSAYSRQRTRETHLGVKRSDETKAKLSVATKLQMQKAKEDGTFEIMVEKSRQKQLGNKRSRESILKGLESSKRYYETHDRKPVSEETGNKISKTHLERNVNSIWWKRTDINTGEATIFKNKNKWLRENNLGVNYNGTGVRKLGSIDKTKLLPLLYKLEKADLSEIPTELEIANTK